MPRNKSRQVRAALARGRDKMGPKLGREAAKGEPGKRESAEDLVGELDSPRDPPEQLHEDVLRNRATKVKVHA